LITLEDRTLLATLVVTPPGGSSPYHTIQAAVTAAAGGDTIQITPSTYTEQVTIGKSLTLEPTPTGTGPVIIQAPSTLNADPLGFNVLVEINNGATVNINNLTVSGPGPSGSLLDRGILVVASATANVTNSTVTLIQNPNALGDQTGNAIQIGGLRTNEEPATATLTNDIISSYQKTGIVVRGGSTATITGNMITGIGPTTAIAQNGIQVDLGATATITGNTITGNEYNGTGSGPDLTSATQSIGILIDDAAPYLSGGTITVTNNTIGGTASGAGNDIGIDSSEPKITVAISGNVLQGNRFEGILISDGTASASGNEISGSNIGAAVAAFPTDASGNPVTVDAVGNLTGNEINNNGQVSGLSFPGAGVLLLNATGATAKAVGNLVSNNITNNGSSSVSSPGILLQSSTATAPQLTANFNRIFGNKVGLDNTNSAQAAAVDATLNWWGSNAGPNMNNNDTTTGTGTTTTSPWLVMSLSASLATIGPGGISAVTADVTRDSNGATHSTAPFFPDGIPIAFTATGGTMTPASVPTQSGSASSNFSSTTPATASASVTLDNQTLSTPITINPIPVPAPPSPIQTTENQPFSQSFPVTGGAGGFVYTISAGQLPPGLALNSQTGLVSGTPTTPGTYDFTIAATDISSASVKQNLTIIVLPAQVAAPTVLNLQRFGFHAQPTTFVLTFSTALDPVSAEDVSNYRLNRIHGHHLSQDILITAAVYDPIAHTVTLEPAHRVYLFAHYRLLVNGSTSTGVKSASGLLLDGNGSGQPGSDYVATFGKEILAGPNDPASRTNPSPHRSGSVVIQVRRNQSTTSSPASFTHRLPVSTPNDLHRGNTSRSV
jgi:hypothetical protein